MENDKQLIQLLPVRSQGIETKKSTWAKQMNSSFENEIKNIFQTDSIVITREDIFKTTDVTEKILKTLFWGYPRGMRGMNFSRFIRNSRSIINFFDKITSEDDKSISLEELREIINDKNGLGLSSISKLLYFFEVKVENIESLIFDSRVVDALKKEHFRNLYSLIDQIPIDNTIESYVEYLKQTHQLAKDLKTKGENIEFYLFTFHNHFE